MLLSSPFIFPTDEQPYLLRHHLLPSAWPRTGPSTSRSSAGAAHGHRPTKKHCTAGDLPAPHPSSSPPSPRSQLRRRPLLPRHGGAAAKVRRRCCPRCDAGLPTARLLSKSRHGAPMAWRCCYYCLGAVLTQSRRAWTVVLPPEMPMLLNGATGAWRRCSLQGGAVLPTLS